MIFYSSTQLFNTLSELCKKHVLMGNYHFFHGTFSSKNVRTITDIDITDYYEIPSTNTLNNTHVNPIRSKELTGIIQNQIKKTKKNNEIIFNNLLAGYDTRFLLNFNITQNGEIKDYHHVTIKHHLKKLYDDKVIKKNEYEALIEKVKDNPTITEFYDLVNELEKYYQLTWDEKEILRGYKTVRKQKFELKDVFQNYQKQFIIGYNPIILTYVVMVDGMYFNLDSTFIICYSKNNSISIEDPEIQNDILFRQKFVMLNEYQKTHNYELYKGLYKNLPKGKFFKMFKRLRSILAIFLIQIRNIKFNEIQIKTIYKIRTEMTELLKQAFSVLDQFKNRCESLIILKKHIDKKIFDELLTDLLNEVKKSHYKNKLLLDSLTKSSSIKKLQELEEDLSKFLNKRFESIFLSFYNRAKGIIKLDIPELNEFKANKNVTFDEPLNCRTYTISQTKPNKKYKFFKSFFEYALDWGQCLNMIPMDDIVVKNTLMYMFNKFKSGLFIEIKNNKIERFVPFFNLLFKNNWSHLIDPRYILQDERTEKDVSKWTAFGCCVKTHNLNDTDDTYYAELKDMLETTLKNNKITDMKFFMNRKDFPIITKNGTEPYHHIFGNNVSLTSYKFNEYAPILSPTHRLDIYADILIPTDNCWQITTQRFFPTRCENGYLDNGFNNKYRGVPWKDKIETAVWRGSSTGCAVDLTNPRLLITKINQEWKNDPKLKGYLDAGVVGQIYKAKKHIGSREVKRVDLKALGIEVLEKMSMKEQMKYKYTLDIEGNASAYRIGYILSFKSVLLKVESDYTMWIDEYLKPNVHYISINKDYSNLATTIEWCREHDKECKKIADNAYKLFRKCFTEDFICKYIAKKLKEMKPLKL
jgi:hypothetical protein